MYLLSSKVFKLLAFDHKNYPELLICKVETLLRCTFEIYYVLMKYMNLIQIVMRPHLIQNKTVNTQISSFHSIASESLCVYKTDNSGLEQKSQFLSKLILRPIKTDDTHVSDLNLPHKLASYLFQRLHLKSMHHCSLRTQSHSSSHVRWLHLFDTRGCSNTIFFLNDLIFFSCCLYNIEFSLKVFFPWPKLHCSSLKKTSLVWEITMQNRKPHNSEHDQNVIIMYLCLVFCTSQYYKGKQLTSVAYKISTIRCITGSLSCSFSWQINSIFLSLPK